MKGVCSYVDAASRIGEIVVPPFAMARTLLTCTDAAIHNSEKRAYLAERRGCRHCRWRDSWCGSYLAAPTGEMHAISLLPLARCMPRKRCHHSFLWDTFTPCTGLKMPQFWRWQCIGLQVRVCSLKRLFWRRWTLNFERCLWTFSPIKKCSST